MSFSSISQLISQSIDQSVSQSVCLNNTCNGGMLPISASTLDPGFSESDTDWSLSLSTVSQSVHGTLHVAC